MVATEVTNLLRGELLGATATSNLPGPRENSEKAGTVQRLLRVASLGKFASAAANFQKSINSVSFEIILQGRAF